MREHVIESNGVTTISRELPTGIMVINKSVDVAKKAHHETVGIANAMTTHFIFDLDSTEIDYYFEKLGV